MLRVAEVEGALDRALLNVGEADRRADLRQRARSPRWPPVTMHASGFWPCSQARCSLVVQPPRDRPSAWSAGSPSGRLRRAPAACWCARTTVESTLTCQVISPAAFARA